MNYGLMISLKVESKLELIDRNPQWTAVEELIAYRRCLTESLNDLDEKPWAKGNIRIGDYILLSTFFLLYYFACLFTQFSQYFVSAK
jgi:hypothetical protein